MADISGTNYAKIALGGSGSNVIEQGEFAGTVKSCYDTVTIVATGDIGYIATPPAGSKIIGFIFSCADLGTGSTIDIGDGDDDDRYAAAIDCSAAVSGNTAILLAGVNYELGTIADDDQMILTAGGSVTAGIIKICVLYV